MPSFVIAEKCDGCLGQDRTACMYICPHDLMALIPEKQKAINQEPEQCWECYNCVKICPTQAVEVRGYADFVPLGANVTPLRSTDSIMWTVKFRNGTLKRFKFPIRSTPEGSVVPDGGWSSSDDLKTPLLFTEPESNGLSELSKLK